MKPYSETDGRSFAKIGARLDDHPGWMDVNTGVYANQGSGTWKTSAAAGVGPAYGGISASQDLAGRYSNKDTATAYYGLNGNVGSAAWKTEVYHPLKTGGAGVRSEIGGPLGSGGGWNVSAERPAKRGGVDFTVGAGGPIHSGISLNASATHAPRSGGSGITVGAEGPFSSQAKWTAEVSHAARSGTSIGGGLSGPIPGGTWSLGASHNTRGNDNRVMFGAGWKF